MALTADIVESWRAPRRVVRRHLNRGRSEPFAFTLLFTFLLLAVVSAAPWLARQAALDHSPVAPRLLGAAYGAVLAVPVFYGFAALGHWTARLMGGKGRHYEGRLALFWALVTISPALLLFGLVRGMAEGSPGVPVLGFAVFALFLVYYTTMLRELET
jgi:hypothetical protein